MELSSTSYKDDLVDWKTKQSPGKWGMNAHGYGDLKVQDIEAKMFSGGGISEMMAE